MIIFTQNAPITFDHIDAVKEMADRIKRVRELIKDESWEDSDSCKVVAVSELLEALDGE